MRQIKGVKNLLRMAGVGDEELAPESARRRARQAALERQDGSGNSSLELAFFRTDADHFIQGTPGDILRNFRETRLQGIELKGWRRFTKNLRLTWGYTYLDAKNRSPGADITTIQNQPEHKVALTWTMTRRSDCGCGARPSSWPPSVAVSLINPLQALVEKAQSRSAFVAAMLTLASIMALAIAAVGLYGTISYLVGRRRKEIGIRMALGARRRQVRSWVLAKGLTLAAVGIAVGLGLALAATRLLGSVLHGVNAFDPFSFVVMPAVLLAVATLATWLPAWRASRIEPLRALRQD